MYQKEIRQMALAEGRVAHLRHSSKFKVQNKNTRGMAFVLGHHSSTMS
jgi:hypothetical protein